MNAKTLLAMGLLGLLGLSGSAWAQNCGGMPAVNGVCIPPDSPTSPLNSTYGQQPGQPAAPRMIWADRWGAIAIDNTVTSGGIGTVVGMLSKRKAEEAALTQCRATGGVGCKIKSSYYNGCGVIAWGDSLASTAHAPSIEEASKLAVQDCSKKTANCSVYYADCSMAERIQ